LPLYYNLSKAIKKPKYVAGSRILKYVGTLNFPLEGNHQVFICVVSVPV
jgi:hypothetical protein